MAEASKVPLESAPDPERNAGGESVNAGLSELAHLARQAFEEKRRKQSLALTNAILKIDPQNPEALVLQSWVRADLDKELEGATRAFHEAKTVKRLDAFDRTERLLHSILGVDAEYQRASELLAEVRMHQSALVKNPPADLVEEEQIPVPTLPKNSSRRWTGVLLALVLITTFGWFMLAARHQPLPAVGQDTQAVTAKPEAEHTTGSLGLYVSPATGVKLAVDDSPAQDVPETLNLSEGTHRLVFTADGYVPATIPQTIVSGKRQILPVVLQRVAESAANTAKDNKPPAPDRDNKAPAKEPAKDSPKESPKEPAKERPEPPLLGSIAVDSVVPIDVFVKGRQVGTTPVTFQLPTGEQSIEYRYQGFQKSASYVIRKGETTRAIITFEIDLQVNAKPWAQVSLDGAQRRVLGQTPLNTRVPVGSVLLFQNPRFPDKKYVVTGRDKTVQVMFP